MNTSKNEGIEDPCEEMALLAQNFLPLERFGFTESYRSKKDERLIYNSKECRVKLVWSGWEMDSGYTLSIYYGRLHAPENQLRMIWNNEECHCWHDLMGTGAILDFLDGLTPQESVVRDGFPSAIDEFRHSTLWKNLVGKRRGSELTVRMHNAIWEHYGIRLFELFDLRKPNLWEKYRQFIKTVYDIEGRSPNIKPPLDSIC
jgi:hypothetical protein